MQNFASVEHWEEVVRTFREEQFKLLERLKAKLPALEEELKKVNLEPLKNRPLIKTLQAKANPEEDIILLEAELGYQESSVEKTFHHPLPAEPTPEEREGEEEEVKTGRRR